MGNNGSLLLITLYSDQVGPELCTYGCLFNMNNFQRLSMLALYFEYSWMKKTQNYDCAANYNSCKVTLKKITVM